MHKKWIPSSFRDPSGFLFLEKGILFRQVNREYKRNYDKLISSGLYEALAGEKLLITHREIRVNKTPDSKVYRVIKPERVSFISYPYEWCFSQLKDAALATLTIQKISLKHGMSLKDASGYNIQFRKGKPIFIDTLSFERYIGGQPWVAYRQFCQHFLAPLALMAYKDVRLGQLLRLYIDGIPLDLTSSLLPSRTYCKLSLLTHIHLHAKSQTHFGNRKINIENRTMSYRSLLGLIDNLESAVRRLTWKPQNSVWVDYYEKMNYSSSAFQDKKKLVGEFLDKIKPKTVWDVGANTGVFSRIATGLGAEVVSFDDDLGAVEMNYREVKKKKEADLLPLLLDLTNPSPAVGWENEERMSLFARGPVDCVLALALVHHVAISNNVPLVRVADFLSKLCKFLIIEFVPKSDSQIKRLLASRKDIFTDYSLEGFEKSFEKYFSIQSKSNIKDSERVLYLMKKR